MFSLKKLFGDPSEKLLSQARLLVPKINALEDGLQARSDEDLRALMGEYRARVAAGTSLDDMLPEVFALVREVSRRAAGMRHFDVQLIGGVVLHRRGIAEMKTGEGKTLVATLPVCLNALAGRGVHVVTVNDYLARRDATWMGQIYAALGLSVGVINGEASYLYDAAHTKEADAMRDEEGSFRVFHEYLRPCSRREAYAADTTYGTNSEFGFDYLRDNTAYRAEDLRMRPSTGNGQSNYHFAIIDEVDSILIDEARTPLIISAPAAESEDKYRIFAGLAGRLAEGADYEVDEKHRTIRMTDAGIARAEKELGIENIYTEGGIKEVHHLETAVRAKALYRCDKEYVVREGKVVIVDEFTGRLQPGRRWSEGLHQAIEAKEGVAVERESRTMASVTYQNFFRMYERVAGMTGTGKTSSEEFYKVYGLETVEIPPNRPVVRHDKNDQIFQTQNGKFTALARRVKELHEKGQPVLIGTVSIETNELLGAFLRREGIPHEMLNAKNHEREGEIVAQAGQKGRVTVATNMAGRGVDIKLGGALATREEYEEVKALGGLAVIGTERHEARRIDNQLRGRSGRQGDPGETQFFVSFDDSLMRVFASDTLKGLLGRFGIPENQPVENAMVTRSLETAQTKIEGFNFDARKLVLEYDNVLDRQRTSVYARRRTILLGSADDIHAALHELGQAQGEDALAMLVTKEEEVGRDALVMVARQVMLQALDMLWVGHLESMEYLRGSVSLRAYGQRDPLIEYRREGLQLFRELEAQYAAQVLGIISKLDRSMIAGNQQTIDNRQQISDSNQRPAAPLPPGHPHVGRNDLCPCGSGKKYKHCHGK